MPSESDGEPYVVTINIEGDEINLVFDTTKPGLRRLLSAVRGPLGVILLQFTRLARHVFAFSGDAPRVRRMSIVADFIRVERSRARNRRKSAEIVAPQERPVRSPAAANFLLYLLLNKHDRSVIPGDLEEEYLTTILPKFGRTRADVWFWMQTAKNIYARSQLLRWLIAGGVALKIAEWIVFHVN